MRQYVAQPESGRDPKSSDTLQGNARRAGSRLDPRLAGTLHQASGADAHWNSPAHASIDDDLDAVSAKLAELKRKAAQDRDLESILAAASVDQERRTRETAEKTAAALDSVAQWVGRTEDRLSETTRLASESQERTVLILNETLGMMTRRLDDIERKITESSKPVAMDAPPAGVGRGDGPAARGGYERAPRPGDPVEASLRGIEQRINKLSDSMAHGAPHAPDRRGSASSSSDLRTAVADIRSRQAELEDAAERGRGTTHGTGANSRSQMELLHSLRDDLARLSMRIETGQAAHAADGSATTLRADINSLRDSTRDLATRDEVIAIERAIRELAGQVGHGHADDRDLTSISEPFESLQAEVRRLADLVASNAHARIHFDVEALAHKLDSLAQGGVDASLLDRIARDLADVRNSMRDVGDPNRFRNLAEQVAGLNHQVAQLRKQFTGPDLSLLKSGVDDIRMAARTIADAQPSVALARELGSLPGRLDRVIEEIRIATETMTLAQPDHGVSRELERLSSRVERAIEDMHIASQAMNTAERDDIFVRELERLSTRVDRAIEDIRLVSHTINTAQPDGSVTRELERLSSRVDRAVEDIRSASQTIGAAQPDEGFTRELERLSTRVDRALAQNGNPAAVEELVNRLDRLNERLGRISRENDLKPIESMLSAMAEKLDRPDHAGGKLDALERQIAALGESIEHSSNQPAFASLHRAMGDLRDQLEGLHSRAAAAAERATTSAIQTSLGSLKAHAEADVDAIRDDFIDLKSAQSAADKRTQDRLGAVHGTLQEVVARLAFLEQDLSQRNEPEASRSPVREAPHAAPASPSDLLDESVKHLQAAVALHGSPLADSEPPATPAQEDELLLDATQARRRPATPQPLQAGAGQNVNEIKASFIAAARRAAQAAAAETGVTGKDKESARRGHAAVLEADKEQADGLAIRIKPALDKRRRPILLAAAAIVLALGTIQVVGVHFGSSGPVTTAAPRRTEMTVAALNPASQQVREPSAIEARRSEIADPRTTDAIPSGPESLPRSTPAGSAGLQPSAERDATLPEPRPSGEMTLPAKADDAAAQLAAAQLAAAAKAAAPALSPIPNIASVGEIPANITPPGLRQAALAGDPVAVYELATRAAEGRGMTRDVKLAARLFEKAAAHGVVPAQYWVGNLHEKGLGVGRDLAAAKTWYQRAADKGNTRAMHNLGVMAAEGGGGKPDYSAAVEWFRRAAQFGVRDSQFNLAVLLARGLGTQQDLAGSYLWFSIVAAQGDEDAAKKRDEISARLSPAELANARAAAERWRAETADKAANEIVAPANGWGEPPAKRAGGSRA
jgi:localization factor PodJL